MIQLHTYSVKLEFQLFTSYFMCESHIKGKNSIIALLHIRRTQCY